MLLIATIRTDEVDPRRAFLAFLAELERDERVDRIDLARLDRDELTRLLADELGHAPDAGLVDRTLERTDGNPFYAEQVVAASRETGTDAVPARLRDVVLARVAAVSDAGQEVLRVASVAGTRIDDELLVAVSDLPARRCELRSARSSIGGSSCRPVDRTTRTSRSVTPCSGRSSTTS